MNNWDLISFVKSSDKRLRILLMLKNTVCTPSGVSAKLGISITHVSSTIKELSEKDLVICLTPERRKTKLYKTTKKGEKVLSKIDDIESSDTIL